MKCETTTVHHWDRRSGLTLCCHIPVINASTGEIVTYNTDESQITCQATHPGVIVMTPTKLPDMGTENHTPRRTVRVPDSIWDAAQEKAAERGETVSAVVVKALENYLRRK